MFISDCRTLYNCTIPFQGFFDISPTAVSVWIEYSRAKFLIVIKNERHNQIIIISKYFWNLLDAKILQIIDDNVFITVADIVFQNKNQIFKSHLLFFFALFCPQIIKMKLAQSSEINHH